MGGKTVYQIINQEKPLSLTGKCTICNKKIVDSDYLCEKHNQLPSKFCYACKNYTTWTEEKRFWSSGYGVIGGSARWSMPMGFIYDYKCNRCGADRERVQRSQFYDDEQISETTGRFLSFFVLMFFVIGLLNDNPLICFGGIFIFLFGAMISTENWRLFLGNISQSDWIEREKRLHRQGVYTKLQRSNWKDIDSEPLEELTELIELQIKIMNRMKSTALKNNDLLYSELCQDAINNFSEDLDHIKKRIKRK